MAFGLSHSFAWAICSRVLCGALNGNIGVAKSLMGEITDSTNQARGFSMFGLVFYKPRQMKCTSITFLFK